MVPPIQELRIMTGGPPTKKLNVPKSTGSKKTVTFLVKLAILVGGVKRASSIIFLRLTIFSHRLIFQRSCLDKHGLNNFFFCSDGLTSPMGIICAKAISRRHPLARKDLRLTPTMVSAPNGGRSQMIRELRPSPTGDELKNLLRI